ncbi:MAG: hypothetical protein ACI9P9_000489, partial [Patescibacteria group bacterium]
MIDIEKVKRDILVYIEQNGPSLPVKISKLINMDTMFSSAILAELTSSQDLKMSSMKIGSSQLYLRQGQEKQLEDFADQYLKNVEKTAYLTLKEKKFLIDKDQEPAIRVALRKIKDFATPFRYKDEIMWRYNFTPKEELQELLNGNTAQEKEEPVIQSVEEQIVESDPIILSTPEESNQEENNLQEEGSDNEEDQEKNTQETSNFESPLEPHKELSEESEDVIEKETDEQTQDEPEEEIQEEQGSSFANEVKQHLNKVGVKISEEIEDSRNEFISKIDIYSDLGKIPFLLIAKNKKTISEADLMLAHQKAAEEKMPLLLLHKG